MSAATDAYGIYKNISEVRGFGSAMTKEERISVYFDIFIDSLMIGVGALLEGPSITASSALLAVAAGKLGTDVGKLINSSLTVSEGKSISSNAVGYFPDSQQRYFTKSH